MFTGIIQATALIKEVKYKEDLNTIFVKIPDFLVNGLTIGASVSNNGCCLTVTKIMEFNVVSFDLIKETLKLTNLRYLKPGDYINLERASILHSEISGHIMSGHIIGIAKIIEIEFTKNSRIIWLKLLNKDLFKYIIYKGFIGIDGISLTIGDIKDNIFCINIIPETIKRTTIGSKKINDVLNIEIDYQTKSIVDTTERILLKDFIKK